MSAILWQSEDENTTLIDIPRSISLAQGPGDASHRTLLSTEPLKTPYQTNEPKSATAKAKLVHNTVDAALHAEYAEAIHNALAKIKASHHDPWCMPRPFVEHQTGDTRKRKASSRPEPQDNQEYDASDDKRDFHQQGEPQESLPDEFLSSLSVTKITMIFGLEGEDLDETENEQTSLEKQSSSKHDQTTLLLANPKNPTDIYNFLIPQESSFILGPCSDSRTLHTNNRIQAQELAHPKTFDFILLDPPWPNRSVKRTHKTANSTYSTAATLDDIHQLLMSMDLDMLMADSALVAIWITNKPAIRELVLGQDGLFDSWGVELEEEWLWLKTTVSGEPVTPIDSVWRKPYEVLLLGRKRKRYLEAAAHASVEQEAVRRRVLVSVPDLHSRKPCLKELIENMLRDKSSYRALEIFARNLVAGWWSWGDECVKFNWEGFWTDSMNQ